MISDDQLKEWRALCEKANQRGDISFQCGSDADFYSASRTAVPALLDEVERLTGGDCPRRDCADYRLAQATNINRIVAMEAERDALRSKLAKAKDGLRDIFELLDSGYLCRDISRDAEPDWALRQIEPAMKLKAARAALDAE